MLYAVHLPPLLVSYIKLSSPLAYTAITAYLFCLISHLFFFANHFPGSCKKDNFYMWTRSWKNADYKDLAECLEYLNLTNFCSLSAFWNLSCSYVLQVHCSYYIYLFPSQDLCTFCPIYLDNSFLICYFGIYCHLGLSLYVTSIHDLVLSLLEYLLPPKIIIFIYLLFMAHNLIRTKSLSPLLL